MAMKAKCASAAGVAMLMSSGSRLRAPITGMLLWMSAMPSAKIRA